MKILVAVLIAVVSIACNAQPKVNDMKPTNKKDTLSYAIGLQIGNSFEQQKLDVNLQMVLAGMQDKLAGKGLLNEEQIAKAMQTLQEETQKAMEESRVKEGAEFQKKSEEWLANNKKASGVMVTPSGLQYKVMTEGKGPKPTADNTVKVHYRGTHMDGKVFDSSYDRNEPAEFPLTGVIRGWTEGLQLMNVGSKYMLYVPAALAYGDQGRPGTIGANEMLIFEVELLDIVKK